MATMITKWMFLASMMIGLITISAFGVYEKNADAASISKKEDGKKVAKAKEEPNATKSLKFGLF